VDRASRRVSASHWRAHGASRRARAFLTLVERDWPAGLRERRDSRSLLPPRDLAHGDACVRGIDVVGSVGREDGGQRDACEPRIGDAGLHRHADASGEVVCQADLGGSVSRGGRRRWRHARRRGGRGAPKLHADGALSRASFAGHSRPASRVPRPASRVPRPASRPEAPRRDRHSSRAAPARPRRRS
jgi:hypothetical protein